MKTMIALLVLAIALGCSIFLVNPAHAVGVCLSDDITTNERIVDAYNKGYNDASDKVNKMVANICLKGGEITTSDSTFALVCVRKT